MLDYQLARELIVNLGAFRGRETDEYSFLVVPLSEFVSKNNFYNLVEINRLAEGILANPTESTQMEAGTPVTMQFLADQIKPWIEAIRQTLFHLITAPFNCIEDAQIWCDEAEKKCDEWIERVDEWMKRVDKRFRKMDKFHALQQAIEEKLPLFKEDIKTWGELKRQGISVDPPPIYEEIQHIFKEATSIDRTLQTLEVGKSPEQDEQVKTYVALLHEILEISKVTGFTVKSVERYILTNTLPVLPSLTLSIFNETQSAPFGTNILNRFARVTIRGDITFEELRSAYLRIRQELGIKRSKRPTAKHLQLYQMVQQKGNIPRGKGTVSFWESLRLEWNKKHPKAKYTTWEGVKVAYDRFCRKMSDRFQGKYQKEAHNEKTHTQQRKP